MTASNGAGAWDRLGALLIQRRTALDPRFHNRSAFCEATGLKYRLVYDIEEARRVNFGASTLAAIEAAYRLAPGSISRFLAGGDPAALDPAHPPRYDGPDDLPLDMSPKARQAAEAHLSEIDAAVARARRRNPGVPLTGRMIFGRNALDAETWDLLAAAGYKPESIALGLAVMKGDDPADRGRQGNSSAAGLARGSRHCNDPRIPAARAGPVASTAWARAARGWGAWRGATITGMSGETGGSGERPVGGDDMSEAAAARPVPEPVTFGEAMALHAASLPLLIRELAALRRSLDAARTAPGRQVTDVALLEALSRIADVEQVELGIGRAIGRAAVVRTFEEVQEARQAALARPPEPEAPRRRIPGQARGQRPLFPHAVRSLVPAGASPLP